MRPTTMPADVAAAWDEVVAQCGKGVEGPELEAFCGQLARLRDAQRRLADEGLVIADPKGNPVPHPAIDIERRAQDEIRKWGSRFRPRAR